MQNTPTLGPRVYSEQYLLWAGSASVGARVVSPHCSALTPYHASVLRDLTGPDSKAPATLEYSRFEKPAKQVSSFLLGSIRSIVRLYLDEAISFVFTGAAPMKHPEAVEWHAFSSLFVSGILSYFHEAPKKYRLYPRGVLNSLDPERIPGPSHQGWGRRSSGKSSTRHCWGLAASISSCLKL